MGNKDVSFVYDIIHFNVEFIFLVNGILKIGSTLDGNYIYHTWQMLNVFLFLLAFYRIKLLHIYGNSWYHYFVQCP